jgi:hypothetical protein
VAWKVWPLPPDLKTHSRKSAPPRQPGSSTLIFRRPYSVPPGATAVAPMYVNEQPVISRHLCGIGDMLGLAAVGRAGDREAGEEVEVLV